jgi:cytochrome c553
MKLRLLISVVGLFWMAPQAAVAADGSATNVWEGVYSEGQAERGAAAMTKSCIVCHAANLKGGPGVPPLVGLEFRFGWEGRSLGELYEHLSATMPTGQPGSLSDQTYVDLIAELLRLNAIPAGDENPELTPDNALLEQIILTFQPPQ